MEATEIASLQNLPLSPDFWIFFLVSVNRETV